MVSEIEDFQGECMAWALETFGVERKHDKKLRALRFIEEAAELCQSLDLNREDAHHIIDYVYDRPKGDAAQEIGGVMTTLAVLCGVVSVDLRTALHNEIERCWTLVDKIRERDLAKPHPGEV